MVKDTTNKAHLDPADTIHPLRRTCLVCGGGCGKVSVHPWRKYLAKTRVYSWHILAAELWGLAYRELVAD